MVFGCWIRPFIPWKTEQHPDLAGVKTTGIEGDVARCSMWEKHQCCWMWGCSVPWLPHPLVCAAWQDIPCLNLLPSFNFSCFLRCNFFFSLRNYLGRWLSLILIHLFQHLHRASVGGKKIKFCRFKKKYIFFIFNLNSKNLRRRPPLLRMLKSFIYMPVRWHSTEMSVTSRWFGRGEGNECVCYRTDQV